MKGVSVSIEEAKGFSSPSQLRFEVTKKVETLSPRDLFNNPELRSKETYLRLEGSLINERDKSVPVIIFPLGGSNPFEISLKLNEKIVRKTGNLKSLPQMSPPPPMKLMIPPQSRIIFRSEINLEDYQYSGSPTATVEWTFHYWNEPKPRGSITSNLSKL